MAPGSAHLLLRVGWQIRCLAMHMHFTMSSVCECPFPVLKLHMHTTMSSVCECEKACAVGVARGCARGRVRQGKGCEGWARK